LSVLTAHGSVDLQELSAGARRLASRMIVVMPLSNLNVVRHDHAGNSGKGQSSLTTLRMTERHRTTPLRLCEVNGGTSPLCGEWSDGGENFLTAHGSVDLHGLSAGARRLASRMIVVMPLSNLNVVRQDRAGNSRRG